MASLELNGFQINLISCNYLSSAGHEIVCFQKFHIAFKAMLSQLLASSS